MPSALQKLSRDIIVYSVLLADYEKPDFKDDALAGVRANYFNSKGASQSDKTEMELDGRRLRLRYEMKTGRAARVENRRRQPTISDRVARAGRLLLRALLYR